MKSWILLSVVMLVVTGSALHGAPPPDAPVLAAIRARLDAVARNDTRAWASYVHDDMLVPLGQGSAKHQWIANHESWPPQVTYWYGPIEDARVKVHGDTAVVTYRARQFTRVGDQTTHSDRWQIETHRRADTGWLLVAVADSPIAARPQAITLESAALDEFVGDYEWAPGIISRFTRDGTDLYEDFADSGPVKLLAASPTEFFYASGGDGDTSRIVFVRDARGRVTHHLFREYGSTDRTIRRLR
jgi:hypothetical protein